ncbi:MAG: diacylglycerol kinase family protein [Candidatus Saccharibacteria bacterium]|nr:diacylglycerol kinase family protein [Candidatus Saccharibacteria bacterium]
MSRLILIYNPNSSNYRRVKKDVLDKKAEIFAGYELSEYTIKKIGFANNVKNLKAEIRDGDFCFALGGDATAAITANAILESEKDAILAVLPYGNFNDLARTLGTMKLSDFVAENGLLRAFRSAAARELAREPHGDGSERRGPQGAISALYPLEIYVDGKFWRYATCYVTIGMTAAAVELFDEPKFRKYMQKGHKSSWRSYVELAKWYFKNRHSKIFLPEFTINGKKTVKKASDYAALSGKSMCRVMKGGEDYKKPAIFRSKALKTISFPRLFILMAKSILFRTPGNNTNGDILEFKNPATVELQAEGEYQIFENIKTIEVRKGEKCLKVITKR